MQLYPVFLNRNVSKKRKIGIFDTIVKLVILMKVRLGEQTNVAHHSSRCS